MEEALLSVVKISDFPLPIPIIEGKGGPENTKISVLQNPFVVAYLEGPCIFTKVLVIDKTPNEDFKLARPNKNVFGPCRGRKFITHFIVKAWGALFSVGVFRTFDSAEEWIDKKHLEGWEKDPIFRKV